MRLRRRRVASHSSGLQLRDLLKVAAREPLIQGIILCMTGGKAGHASSSTYKRMWLVQSSRSDNVSLAAVHWPTPVPFPSTYSRSPAPAKGVVVFLTVFAHVPACCLTPH